MLSINTQYNLVESLGKLNFCCHCHRDSCSLMAKALGAKHEELGLSDSSVESA